MVTLSKKAAFVFYVAALVSILIPSVPVFAQSNNSYYQQQQQQQQWQRQQDQQRQMQDQQRQQMQAQQRQQMQDQQRQQMQAQQRQQMQDQQRQQMQAQQRQQMQDQQRQQVQTQQRQQLQQQQQTQQRQQLQNQQRQTQQQQQQQQQRQQQQGKLGTLQSGASKATASGFIKMNRPPTPGEIQRGFTGRVTSDGRALIKFQNRVFTVPASRVSGLSARLAANQNRLRAAQWTAQQKNGINQRIKALANGSGGSSIPPSLKSQFNTAGTTKGVPQVTYYPQLQDRIDKGKSHKRREIALQTTITTPHGIAKQSDTSEALAARERVEKGAIMYRIGTTNISGAAEAQFWSLENPLSPGYAAKHGIPESNVQNANFVERATLKPGAQFVTRHAPPVGNNPGGAVEVVVSPNSVQMESFNHFGEQKK